MNRTEVSFNIETVPLSIQPYFKNATIYDSSCSEHARTLYVEGTDRASLKISKRGSLEREYKMSLSSRHVAPKVIAYDSDNEHDYLLSEAVSREDWVSGLHIDNPKKLARVFGEHLSMLHSLSTEGCPYPNRTTEMLNEANNKGINPILLNVLQQSAIDDVIIHGDYCLH